MANKTILIAKREYLTRVKKKSFLIMTLVSPLLITLFYGLIIYFTINKDLTEKVKVILIADPNHVLEEKLEETKNLKFQFLKDSLSTARELIENGDCYGVLKIDRTDKGLQFELLAGEQPSINTVSTIEDKIEQKLKDKELQKNGINQELLSKINKTKVNVDTRKLGETDFEEGSSGLTTAIGFLGAILIYLFIFLYGVQVMRGVIEEKTNRIVEVIISSVKPFELMMGKITGIALVGLTQFIIWVALVAALSGPVSGFIMNLMDVDATTIATQTAQGAQGATKSIDLFKGFENLNLPLILGMFIFYFISGYLFYGALFAAIGSAVDNETDTQQFMLPVTMPLIFSFVLAQTIVTNDPNSTLSIWLSMIPLSSPIIMMVRLPFGIPVIQIVGSMLLMVAGFIFTVWFAGRIYRIGILTYGKKPSYNEIIKWLFRKN